MRPQYKAINCSFAGCVKTASRLYANLGDGRECRFSLTRTLAIIDDAEEMLRLSTREAARKLGIDHATLANYVKVGKLPAPETLTVGRRVVHMWTEAEIEHVRKLLPKIVNGRKTRYQKKHSAFSNQQSAKTTKKRKKPEK